MTASSKQVLTINDKNIEISINHQKLIEATIETIAERGLADTTISHVAQKAKVSQGYASFRFKSKENLLLSSLKFLSDEYKKSWQKIFEDKNLDPIDRLLRIFENDFSKKIANRNKISVWVAGLQTKGKHYLAKAWNIEKFTQNRFSNINLNESAEPLEESMFYEISPINYSNKV